jgi:predicted O-methyltransferase YrrM
VKQWILYNTRWKFDLVFIDADKKTILIILISFFQNEQGGLSFLTMYCGGKVLEPLHERQTQNTIRYNALLKNDRGRNRFLPIRDGLTVSRVI